jgi:hypothetical protein
MWLDERYVTRFRYQATCATLTWELPENVPCRLRHEPVDIKFFLHFMIQRPVRSCRPFCNKFSNYGVSRHQRYTPRGIFILISQKGKWRGHILLSCYVKMVIVVMVPYKQVFEGRNINCRQCKKYILHYRWSDRELRGKEEDRVEVTTEYCCFRNFGIYFFILQGKLYLKLVWKQINLTLYSKFSLIRLQLIWISG